MMKMTMAVLLGVATSLAFPSQVPPRGLSSNVEVRILQQSCTGTTFEVKVLGLDSVPVEVEGEWFTRLKIVGCHEALLDTGRPEVPRVSVMLAVPTSAECSVRIDSIDTTVVEVEKVYPLQPMRPLCDTTGQFFIDRAFYDSAVTYPGAYVACAEDGQWRDLRVLNLDVCPVQVNPGLHTATIASYLKVTVSYSTGDYPSTVSDWMMTVYGRYIDNFSLLPVQSDLVRGYRRGSRLLVFRYSGYEGIGVRHLTDWARLRGIETREIQGHWPTEASTGEIRDSIFAEFYRNDSVLRWVLLVGDVNPPEISWGDTWSHEGDYVYSCVTRDPVGRLDAFPDIGVARLSPGSDQNLDSVVAKILAYQQTPPPAAGWAGRLVYVGNKDTVYSGPRRTDPTVFIDLVRDLDSMQHYTYWNPERRLITGDVADNSNVRAALNDSGAGILMYAGHGFYTCWAGASSPGWNHLGQDWRCQDVDTLRNEGMAPVVFNMACLCGAIQCDTECLTETWLRTCPGGAVASLGANAVVRKPNVGACSSLVRALCDVVPIETAGVTYSPPYFDLGGCMMYMNAYILKNWFNTKYKTYTKKLLAANVMLGDPTMPVWVGGMPESADVAGLPTDTIPLAPCTLALDVRLKNDGRALGGALVCAMGPDTSVYVVARTDEQGHATLPVPPLSPPGGCITVTITEGHATDEPHTPMLPYQDTIIAGCPAWTECDSVPRLLSGKAVKAGGWLAYDVSTGRVYVAKGNRTRDFYAYDRLTGGWLRLRSVPDGSEGRPPSKGCRGICDDEGRAYMVKGNNSLGFWRYDAAADSWTGMPPVPREPGNCKVKSGSDMVYAEREGSGYVYLLKGYRCGFCRFNILADTWERLADAPNSYGGKWPDGSWLVYDDSNTIYAHKGKYHELWRYDVSADSWLGSALPGMPRIGKSGRSKRSKAGGSAVQLGGVIYALKGGNTQEMWVFNPATGAWTESDTISRRSRSGLVKRVKDGGDVAAVPGVGLYAIKGNNCNEFWRYVPHEDYRDAFAMPFGMTKPAHPPTDDGESPLLDGFDASRPRWNALGTWCTYTRTDSLGFESVFMYPKGGAAGEVQLTHGLDCSDPVFSPDGMWVAFGVDDDSVTEREQIAKVLAVPAPTPAIMLTQEPTDFRLPEWSPEGLWLCAERDDPLTGYTQICRIPANGGPAQVLTQGNSDHEEPSWLNPFELCYLLSPNDEYSQVARYNLLNQQQTVLSSLPTDHEHPSAAFNGTAAVFEVMDDGGTVQIGRVQAGGGAELTLTNGIFDMSEPDASQDGFSIYCARWLGLTSEIGWVNGNTGQYQAMTDGSAIRDNPDANWDPIFQVNHVIYERLDTSQVSDFGPQKPRKGTGIFYAKHRPRRDGVMGAGLGVLALHKALPNPFCKTVKINWQVPKLQDAALKVYNTAGQLVRTLAEGPTKPGAYTTVWNGTDHKGRRLAAGVYFYTLETGDKRLSRKVVLAE